jgi:hypothetical protein
MGKVTTRKVAAKPAAAKKGAVKFTPVKKEKAVPADVSAKVEALLKQAIKARKLQAVADVEKAKEAELRDDILALFGKKKLDGMRHRLGSLSMFPVEYPIVDDIEALKKFAKLKGNDDLLKVGASSSAIKARWDAGKQVPGVTKGKGNQLRVTLAKAK